MYVSVQTVQIETRQNSSEQFSIFASLNELCDMDMNYSVVVFFGVMDINSEDCNLRESLKGNISIGVPQIFTANTCTLSLKDTQRYCVVATLEMDAGGLRGSYAWL